MLKVALAGNCQVESLSYLLRALLPDAQVTAYDVSAPPIQAAQARAAFDKALPQADLILTHPVESMKEAFNALDTRRQTRVTIAPLYFRGLFPDSCYLGDAQASIQEPSLYHSVVVLDAFKRGLTERQAVDAFSIDRFTELGLMDAWASSLDESRRRDALVDFPVTALVDAFCHAQPGFMTFNHPTLGLLSLYLIDVLKKLGHKVTPFNAAAHRDPLRFHDILPVHDFVADAYKLPYRTSQHWMIEHLGGQFLNRATYVARCYAFYRRLPHAQLVVRSPVDLCAALHAVPQTRSLVDGGAPAQKRKRFLFF